MPPLNLDASGGERFLPAVVHERRRGVLYSVVARRIKSGRYIGFVMLSSAHVAHALNVDTLNKKTDEIAQRDEPDVLPLERAENFAIYNVLGLKPLPKGRRALYFWYYTGEYDDVKEADSALDALIYRLDAAAHDPDLAAFANRKPTPAKPMKPAITAKKLVAAVPVATKVQIHFDGTGWVVSAEKTIRPFRFAGHIAAEKYAEQVGEQYHIPVVTD